MNISLPETHTAPVDIPNMAGYVPNAVGLRQGDQLCRHRPPIYIYRSQTGADLSESAIPHDPGGPTGDQSPYLQTLGPEDLEALPVSLEYPPPPCPKKQFS